MAFFVSFRSKLSVLKRNGLSISFIHQIGGGESWQNRGKTWLENFRYIFNDMKNQIHISRQCIVQRKFPPSETLLRPLSFRRILLMIPNYLIYTLDTLKNGLDE